MNNIARRRAFTNFKIGQAEMVGLAQLSCITTSSNVNHMSQHVVVWGFFMLHHQNSQYLCHGLSGSGGDIRLKKVNYMSQHVVQYSTMWSCM